MNGEMNNFIAWSNLPKWATMASQIHVPSSLLLQRRRCCLRYVVATACSHVQQVIAYGPTSSSPMAKPWSPPLPVLSSVSSIPEGPSRDISASGTRTSIPSKPSYGWPTEIAQLLVKRQLSWSISWAGSPSPTWRWASATTWRLITVRRMLPPGCLTRAILSFGTRAQKMVGCCGRVLITQPTLFFPVWSSDCIVVEMGISQSWSHGGKILIHQLAATDWAWIRKDGQRWSSLRVVYHIGPVVFIVKGVLALFLKWSRTACTTTFFSPSMMMLRKITQW